MVYKSPFPLLDIPETNILSYVFPDDQTPSNKPIWIDAQDPTKSLSSSQALEWIKRLGSFLEHQRIPKGEVVMILTPNHIFVPVAYLGIVGAGRVFSGANPIYTSTEIEHQIRNTGTRLILVHPSLVGTAVEAARKAGLGKDSIFQFSDHPCQPFQGVQDWRDVAVDADRFSCDQLGETSRRTLATINYSSGTTGLPKGVCVSHYNIIANSEQTIFIRDQEQPYQPSARPEERWLGFLPLYHAYGQLYMCVMAPRMSIPVYIMQKFVYEDFLNCIQKYRITHLQAAPPILVMLDKRPETSKYDLSSVKNILCGAAPLSKELQNAVSKRFKVNIIQGWGMTEVTCGAVHVPGGRVDDSGSVGVLDPNCECKLLDDDGKEVAAGEPGEMHVKGPQICLGYWKNASATKETLDDEGWLKTGDIAVVRKDWFWIVDRKKELIKVNALQVAPAELEAVLLEHESIADAAVVGITLNNEEWPRAYVTLKDDSKGKITEEHIQEWMKDRVAKHKRLVGGIRFIDEVPKLASGKIQRKVMRDWAKRDAQEMQGSLKARL
ncbi:hypothetical protein EDD37DRAFT_664153 [Exophiala viscosa]|uniref:4-coumarate-CoA ligase n=1 Tax=Exophiala viscosa TaxID=2486360 RepID=A0AAN6DV99_9EURO|nr:hypothetical protein EDD36DRAFT_395699 [Exophiala viscosa]KAI1625805.1 hypothetical protein EDD37DRAFT_664153 [Exophiala viscosa]